MHLGPEHKVILSMSVRSEAAAVWVVTTVITQVEHILAMVVVMVELPAEPAGLPEAAQALELVVILAMAPLARTRDIISIATAIVVLAAAADLGQTFMAKVLAQAAAGV